tara:strand:+ start:76 stop:450 length:375 start_codon:yes stop_codon:yes gene_type:complete
MKQKAYGPLTYEQTFRVARTNERSRLIDLIVAGSIPFEHAPGLALPPEQDFIDREVEDVGAHFSAGYAYQFAQDVYGKIASLPTQDPVSLLRIARGAACAVLRQYEFGRRIGQVSFVEELRQKL